MAFRVNNPLACTPATPAAAESSAGAEATAAHAPHSTQGAATDKRYFDRDESDLAYVGRIAARANDEGLPLLERLRFLEIAQDVLDEFVAVRLCRSAAAHRAPLLARLLELRNRLFGQLTPICKELSAAGLTLPDYVTTPPEAGDAALEAARRELLPALTPLTVDAEHPFPRLRHGQRAVLLGIEGSGGDDACPLIVPLPPALDDFVGVNPDTWMRSDQLLCRSAAELAAGRQVGRVALIRVLRQNDLAITGDGPSLREEVQRGLELRPHNPVVCVEISDDATQEQAEFVLERLSGTDASEHPILLRLPGRAIGAATGLRDVARSVAATAHRGFVAFRPASLPELTRHDGDLFSAMAERDFILHSPYQDFAALQHLLWQAAEDSAVVAIRQTLYRTDSGVVGPLLQAARNGKDVTVVVEIEARENERENIALSQDLERAGAHIVHGIVGLKVHAKLLHIVRREHGRLREYAVFSTGNFHPGNASAYGDLTLFSADAELAADLRRLLNYVTGHLPAPATRCLTAAPHGLREALTGRIRREADNARAGRASGIWLKVNSLLDREVIDALYDASQAGVPIWGSVRRHCALRPGVPGLSASIEIRSLIGRFLEHARVFCFANGAEMGSDRSEVFIASADCMPRNFDERVEVLVPIRDQRLRSWLIREYRQRYLDDTADSWRLEPDGGYTRLAPDGVSAQADFMTKPSGY